MKVVSCFKKYLLLNSLYNSKLEKEIKREKKKRKRRFEIREMDKQGRKEGKKKRKEKIGKRKGKRKERRVGKGSRCMKEKEERGGQIQKFSRTRPPGKPDHEDDGPRQTTTI